MVIALGHEEYHHRCRQPSDAVQEYLRRRLCLLVGLNAHPSQVVDRHGDDGDDLQCVAALSFFHHYSNHNVYDVIQFFIFMKGNGDVPRLLVVIVIT